MSSDLRSQPVVIELRHVAKYYSSRPQPVQHLWQALSGQRTSNDSSLFTALHTCNLSIRKGEVVGIVGKNGAGKSTLLQLLSRTLKPSQGEVRIVGNLSAILELGAGFNSEFSGRENIYLGLATAGLDKFQTQSRVEQVIEFSGIRKFIDQPIKTYSSGMYVRLAFAIATCSDPDILIIDEALSVGDGEFARKSFDRIMQLKESGVTILFCSHSLFHIEALCSRAIWLDSGKLIRDGHPHQIIPAYQDFLDGAATEPFEPTVSATTSTAEISHSITLPNPIVPTARLKKLSFKVAHPNGDISSFAVGSKANMHSGHDTLIIQALFDSNLELPSPSFAATLHGMDGRIIASAGSWIDRVLLERNEAGTGQIEVRFESLSLLKGTYSVSVFLFCERGLHIYDNADHALHLIITQDGLEQGLFHAPRTWTAKAESLY